MMSGNYELKVLIADQFDEFSSDEINTVWQMLQKIAEKDRFKIVYEVSNRLKVEGNLVV